MSGRLESVGLTAAVAILWAAVVWLALGDFITSAGPLLALIVFVVPLVLVAAPTVLAAVVFRKFGH